MFEKFKKKRAVNQEQIEEIKHEVENIDEEEIQKHGEHFSDEKFWEKLGKFAKKAGSSVVYVVLILYYTLQKPEIPMKVKATIVGALGYFILPIDLIPDVALGVGFIDDLGVLTAALLQVAVHVDDEVKAKAKEKLQRWFGEKVDTTEIDEKLQG
ncbi:YkvA family protein [Ornithinibacillus californiensis]|uniref:YkvA family protein n=1 Tax=Ornithinibacillus californiensis TaxID=161536 RepID=UPI000A03E281|nr:YkvA family protein [Ornithinibacillus californiensis]